jgi:surfeit locus 1 family protein
MQSRAREAHKADDDAQPPRSRRALVLMVGALALVLLGFAALGAWQVQRLGWKRDLIARIEQHARTPPVSAPGASQWAGLTPQADEYRRVRVRGRFRHDQATLVRAGTELGAGYWVLTPLRTAEGDWILVNRGFVHSNRELGDSGESKEDEEIVGLLRVTEPGGGLLQHNDAAQQRWYSRDVAAIAAARGLPAGQTAPYFIDAAADPRSDASAWPRPGLTVLRFSDNHLVYACTWFALAAMVAGAIAYILADDRRQRRLQGPSLL